MMDTWCINWSTLETHIGKHDLLCNFKHLFFDRSTLQIDGPYNELFYEKLLDLSTEDDGTVIYALTKVSLFNKDLFFFLL